MSIIKHCSHTIDILLGTFQGESYLEELLRSIFSQTYQDFCILIRDDGSTDRTLEIIKTYSQSYPSKIILITSTTNLGVKKNFSELLKHSHAPYVMFADQDDYWLPNKIEVSMYEIKQLESIHGTHVPLLVHTDLKVVDHQLKLIAPSFWKFTNINPLSYQLNRLLTQNIFTGCTLLFNRSLANLAFPIPNEAIMHDWWVGLIASCFGFIQTCSKQTILYRQHTDNQVGAKKYSFIHGVEKLFKKKATVTSTLIQAQFFLDSFKFKLQFQPSYIRLLTIYSQLNNAPFLSQKYLLLKHRFFKQGFLRNLKNFISFKLN
ncbi:MAG: glycosyltransferase family 2 protein [Parachlamydiaceae bacterium]|nr:glycosyltransferase family 2 protein [Parachlamydiaceae bacterium]